MATDDNKQHMQRIMEALARGDRGPFGAAMADDFTWTFATDGVWAGSWRGKERVRQELLAPLFAQFRDRYTNRASRILGDGDFVVVECQGEVTTHRGDRYANRYCYVCRFAAGKLAELTEYMDTALAERVLDPPSRPSSP
jgi:uncharacterized protein